MKSESDAVRAANARFYSALSAQNLLEMEEVWAHGANVQCVHPGAGVLRGWESIRDSWRSIFTSAICLTVEPDDSQVTVVGPAAVVTCREFITTFTREGASRTTAQATNVYEKRLGRWHLIVHHASILDRRDGDRTV